MPKSGLQITIMPERPSDGEGHSSDVIYARIAHRCVQYSMLDLIVATVWSLDKTWDCEQMISRKPLSHLNGVPC